MPGDGQIGRPAGPPLPAATLGGHQTQCSQELPVRGAGAGGERRAAGAVGRQSRGRPKRQICVHSA